MSAAGDGGTTELFRKATATLEANWNGNHTLPATGLYPHQWSWDSGFIAMGLRHISPRRAGQEMDSLLAGQWEDGRIPQIIFDPHRDEEYSPGAAFWNSGQIPGSASKATTAGLIQPPNHAWAIWQVHLSDPEESRRRSFLVRTYPRLVAWHRYLSTRRNRGGNGLASIVHPWESGTDNSPLWDEALRNVPSEARTPFRRPDLLHADAAERPSTKEYGKYFWLAERYRDHQCDDADEDYPFLFEDPLFNTLLAVSELALADIANEIGEDPAPHRHRAAKIAAALNELFDEDLGCYTARNARDGSLVPKTTVNGLIPLLIPGLPTEAALLRTLTGPKFLGSGALMVPSYDVTAEDMDPALYWRGPAWFNMTWLIITALARLGEVETACRLAGNLTTLAANNDFPEYVNPSNGQPHGARHFSWTAALTLDLEITAHNGVDR